MKSEVLFVQKYPAHGYEVRTELIENPDEGCDPTKMLSAYTDAGAYIGDRRDAIFLCEEKGIKPELKTPESNVCSIGFCDGEQKWYGWSHRAYYGFGIGDWVQEGDSAYVPNNADELLAECKEYGENAEIVDAGTVRIGVEMYTNIGENEDGTIKLSEDSETEYHIIKVGRGEWKAETLEDAKQMAIDFAESVA